MILKDAREIAETVMESMAPYCERVAIAGSIRREVPTVKDIELVAIPKMVLRPSSVQRLLFGGESLSEPTLWNMLHTWAVNEAECGLVRWIKPGVAKVEDWSPKPDAKYLRGLLLKTPVKMDLFIATPENFAVIYLIRTGSADFSEAVVTHGKRIGHRVLGGFLRAGSNSDSPIIPTLREEDVFEQLGLAWVEPSARTTRYALRAAVDVR